MHRLPVTSADSPSPYIQSYQVALQPWSRPFMLLLVGIKVKTNTIFSAKEHTKLAEKRCDVIINKDKGVSRVHSEITVDEMICMDQLQKRHLRSSSKVRIRDCSKYGTFINKNLASAEKVHEFPNKETMLKEGDLVAFGNGNAKYRFSFVPVVLFTSSSKPSERVKLQDIMSLIGE
ncbi:Mre11 complex subunit Nbs1 [Orobanche gracilis]